MRRELELKLELSPDEVEKLPRLDLLAGIAPVRSKRLSVYFDTRSGKLRKAGFHLRIRESGGKFIQTIKSAGKSAGLFDRREWEREVASLTPDAEAAKGTPVEAILKPSDYAKLIPVTRAQITRTAWLVSLSETRLEIVLDEGRVSAGDADQMLSEIEIERLEGRPDGLFSAARAIADQIPVRLGVLSKAERGFALADGALSKPAKAAPIRVDATMTAAEGITVIVHACLKQFRLNEPLVLEDRNADALHQARVAMRRLRAAFSLFGAAVRDPAFAQLRDELRWFTGQLGEARNLDVYLNRLACEDASRADVQARREEAYDAVGAAMHSERFRRLMLELVVWLHTGAWRRGRRARVPLAALAARRLASRWQKIAAVGGTLAELDEESRHRLRIDVKKLRYALEFLRGLHRDEPRRQKKFLAALEGLQEELGQLNDLATAAAIMAELEAKAVGETGATAQPQPQPQPDEEAALLEKAEAHFRSLRKIGPYWLGGLDQPTT